MSSHHSDTNMRTQDSKKTLASIDGLGTPKKKTASSGVYHPTFSVYNTAPPVTPSRDLKNLPVSSPTGTASTASSPGATDDVWDLPETPYILKSSGKLAAEVLTPFTPPTTYGIPIKKEIDDTPIAPLAGRINHAQRSFDKNNQEKGSNDDYFQPRLTRNLTAQFQLISDENAKVAAEANYNKNPSLDFSQNLKGSAEIYKPLKIKKEAAPTSGNVQVKPGNSKASLDNKVVLSKSLSYLEHIIPSDIHSKLQTKSSICVASLVRNPTKRCSNSCPGRLNIVDDLFGEISRINTASKYSALPGIVSRLIPAVMCGSHSNVALTGPKSNPRMKEFKKLTSSFAKASREERSMFESWLQAVSNLCPRLDIEENTESTGTIDMQNVVIAETKTEQPAASKALTSSATVKSSYGLKFEPYQPKWSKYLTVSQAIQEKIVEPLKPTDQKDGFIYIFWEEGKFGKVKIGRTNNLERRLKQWNHDCKRAYKYHKNPDGDSGMGIPHTSRIEKLLHIELKQYREQAWCEECNRHHREWFNVSVSHAEGVYAKWKDWVLKMPYAEDPVSKEWILRSDMDHTEVSACTPEPVQTARPKPRRKSEGLQRKVKGKSARKTI